MKEKQICFNLVGLTNLTLSDLINDLQPTQCNVGQPIKEKFKFFCYHIKIKLSMTIHLNMFTVSCFVGLIDVVEPCELWSAAIMLVLPCQSFVSRVTTLVRLSLYSYPDKLLFCMNYI